MKIWPNIAQTTLEKCSKGAIVHMVGSRVDNLLAIVCEDNYRVKGLIYLGKENVVFQPFTDPSSIDVFLYEGDPVLLLDHDSATTSYNFHEARVKMGLVVFVESSCYMNVSHIANKMRPEFRYHFKGGHVSPTSESDKGNSVVFRNWSLALTNPDTPHAKPLEIFSMKLK